jgi:Dolichyl-phosphate-mannose-protein mannosyltransferase
MYGHEYYSQYNHPPLSGVMLLVVNWLVDLGVAGVPFLIRVPATVADIVTALVVFELVGLRRSLRQAAMAGVLISVSPALIVISGFHGNTDAVFVMFTVLSAYCVTRGWSLAAGIAIALALSVKLIPIVVVPVLVACVLRAGWRKLVAFVAGGLAVFVPLWGPVLLLSWPEFKANVLDYAGSLYLRQWGLPQFLSWADAPPEWANTLSGSGRFVLILISGLVPAVLVWRRPTSFVPAVGVSLALFLLLSPAFGMQYLSWPLAAAYLVGNIPATAYNLAASVFVLRVYSYWSGGGFPWEWYEAKANILRWGDLRIMVVAWVALAWVAVAGLRGSLLAPPDVRERTLEIER